VGEVHDPEPHLIPLVLDALAGRRDTLSVYGDDYDTPDGTCVRDYIHVSDLAQAHLLALKNLQEGALSTSYNLGNGNGFSIRQLIEVAGKVSGRQVPYEIRERRPGDPAALIGNADKIRAELGWSPQFPNLQDIIDTAWRWHQKYHSGGK
jgi:UDP-glucose 4-epimerase